MWKKYKWWIVLAGAVVLGLAFGAGLLIGQGVAGRNTDRIIGEYEQAIIDYEREMGRLTERLGDVESRIDRVGDGLGNAIKQAGGITDRARRIEILVDGIIVAVGELREIAEGGEDGGGNGDAGLSD